MRNRVRPAQTMERGATPVRAALADEGGRIAGRGQRVSGTRQMRAAVVDGRAASPARAAIARVRQVPAVTRAVAILRHLGRSGEPLGVHAIARAVGIVPSTCLHILRVLAAEELVAVDPETKRYRVGTGLLSIANGALRRHGFTERVQPELDRLSRRYGVTAIGVEVAGLDHIVVVAISRSAHAMRLHVDIGSRFPALISASGRCVAAFGGHAWSAIERAFKKLRWDRPPAWRAWRAEVEATRRHGHAVDEGNYIKGVTVVAAPVGTAGGAVSHVVVVVGLSEQVRDIGIARLARDLSATAQAITEKLGGRE
jgi:DNA-binding IclR family transcriptional regulator